MLNKDNIKMKKPFKSLSRIWMWALFLILPGVASGLRLLNISGPSVVVSRTTELLVLDCEYELSERDKHGLVVKWYFNRDPFPAYQWVPNHLPASHGILKERIDPNYHISNDPYMKHRALAIRNPTVELTGEYTCWVSSFQSEAMARKNVIIYSPASEFTLTWTKPTEMSVLVFCKASGVYPEPHITLYRIDDSTHRNAIDNSDVQLSQDEEGYTVTVQRELYDYELEKETVFKCELIIPGTDYQLQEETVYYPAADYEYDDDLHNLNEHRYFYDLQKSHQGGPPATTTTSTTTTSTTTSSTSTTAASIAAIDNFNKNNNVNQIKDYYTENDLSVYPSNNIVNKENDKNIDSVSKAEPVVADSKAESVVAERVKAESVVAERVKAESVVADSKAESVVAEETPRLAPSVSRGENNSWSLILLCPLVLLQIILQ